MVSNMDILWPPPKKTPAIRAIMLYSTDIRSYERQQRQHQVSMTIIQVSEVEAARIKKKAKISINIKYDRDL